MNYKPAETRYAGTMQYAPCGKSGLLLPRISLGLWHNFGQSDSFTTATQMIRYAFDHGITHFDLANNYGPPAGSAETNFGKILKKDFKAHRDEMVIASKAGHAMWPGPYGDGSSRKSLMASIDQSLKRTGLEYFDIFYSHRYDGKTPIEETMQALIDMVRQGKALYVGLSKYPPQEAQIAYDLLREAGVPCLVHQDRYNLFTRQVEQETLPLVQEEGCGFIAFSPLAQGLLTDKYLQGIPKESRAARDTGFLQVDQVTSTKVKAAMELNKLAKKRGQSLAEMALAWVLHTPQVTSVIVGASSVNQLSHNLNTLYKVEFSPTELKKIERILAAMEL